jgi:ribosomal peptide maturation radical SAM protein 1
MGAALHRSFPWIDTIVRGEGEQVLPELISDVLSGNLIRHQPGLCFRRDGESVIVDEGPSRLIAMDDVPMPNYDEFFERLQRSPFSSEVIPKVAIQYEASRGCWWGEKSHCTFCGLNGSTMTFRSKSADRVVNETYYLASKYKQVYFELVDNILDMKYIKDVLPKLRDYRHAGLDFSFFIETKSNLNKEHLRMMRDAGVRRIQPGIESLSTPILKLMRKGVSGLQNIRLLKWAQQFNIYVEWNVLYGFPGEPVEEYEKMADIMQSITHLQPPNISRLLIERFSPYHKNAPEFGLREVKPDQFYRFLYNTDEDTLNDLAYDFIHEYEDGRNPDTYFEMVKSVIEMWQETYKQGINSLTYKRGPGFLNIDDRRSNLETNDYFLREKEALIYLCCDAGATPSSIQRCLQDRGYSSINLEEVKDFLDALLDARLMYKEKDHYLALAIPLNADASDMAFEMYESTPAQSLVQLGA